MCVEAGISWAAALQWSLDSRVGDAARRGAPLERRPSETFREHVWFTTQPIEEPRDPADLARALGMVGMDDRLMFATDYPHWDFDSPGAGAAARARRRAAREDPRRERGSSVWAGNGSRRMIDATSTARPRRSTRSRPYLDDYWREYVPNAGMRLNPTLTGAYPPAAGPPAPRATRRWRPTCSSPGAARRDPELRLTSFEASAATSTTRPR